MKSEKIVRVWRLVYARLFDDCGYPDTSSSFNFKDKNGDYTCEKLFWRFYIII